MKKKTKLDETFFKLFIEGRAPHCRQICNSWFCDFTKLWLTPNKKKNIIGYHIFIKAEM